MRNDRSALTRMYRSFDLFAQAAAARGHGFVPLSAGANWTTASPSVLRCLHHELDSALTYRDYSRSAGPRAVTDALEHVEFILSSGWHRPAVTVTGGTAEGARLVFELLERAGRFRPRSRALMVGHGFPFYAHLCGQFDLSFREVLGDDQSDAGYLPGIERVVHRIERDRPGIVFLVVPNNPIGECYTAADLSALVHACSANGSALLVDRVCMLPWDDHTTLGRAIAPLVQAGDCFVVDSFSKSESLAGLRTGFIVASTTNRDRLIELNRERRLNPIVFSTMTLAFCRLAMLSTDSCHNGAPTADDCGAQQAGALSRQLVAALPVTYTGPDLAALYAEFRPLYRQEILDRQRVILENYETLKACLGMAAARPMRLDAGFNVAVTLPSMIAANEELDQYRLAHQHGVGLLTEACFRRSPRAAGNYFVRIGLSLPRASFNAGLELMRAYFQE